MQKMTDKIVLFLDEETIEHQARQQLRNISEMEFIFKHIAVMPDCHLGKGATVGSCIPTKGAIIPAAVGVDIGCGMVAVKTPFFKKDLPKDLKKLRESIARSVPLSAGRYNQSISPSAKKRIEILEKDARKDYSQFVDNWKFHLGTLGSGNHFIEISLDENDQVYAFLHSGSRGIGNKIAMHHIKVAQEQMKKYHIKLVDKDLAYLSEGTLEFNDYIQDLYWAQKFALLNREEMMDRTLRELSYFIHGEEVPTNIELERIQCHHNFTRKENHFGENVWISRKGAILASEGTMGLIPGSMGTKSYIVSGLGNKMSFDTAPHGAGRRFSRSEAKRRFTMEDFERELEGVEVNHSEAFIDEIPSAYKDIDLVMENSKELVKIERTLKQIVNVKGN